MRLFVSIDLPSALAPAVEAVQDEVRDAEGLRFTDPAGVHVTLKFLGDVDADELPAVREAIAEAVAAADVGPFEATLAGLGVFPSTEYIRVLWLGVDEGGAEMTRLHEALEPKLVALGFDPEDHEFTPHVTLARMEHAGGKETVQEAVRTLDAAVGAMDVTEVRLTESELTDEGPRYSTVERFPLDGRD